MSDEVVNTVDLASTATNIANDMSMWGMFWNADMVSKIVLIILLFCSIWIWAIIFDKYTSIKALNRRSNKFEDSFWSGESLEKLYERVHKKPADPMTSIFVIGMREWRRGNLKRGGAAPHAGLMHRIDRVMAVAISREMTRAERYMNFLATVGAVAPFLGLFGTVWGIMDSFTAIATSNNTNITVVAPGIAAALSTTALGLIAAIPAVVAFNKFNNDLSRYGDRLEGFSTEFSSILARHLEEAD